MTFPGRLPLALLFGTLLWAAPAEADSPPPSPCSCDGETEASIEVYGPGARWVTRTVTASTRLLKDFVVADARIERGGAHFLTRFSVGVIRDSAKFLAGLGCPLAGLRQARDGASRPD